MITIPMMRVNARLEPENAARVIFRHLFNDTNRFKGINIYDVFCDIPIIQNRIKRGHVLCFWGYSKSEDGSTWTSTNEFDLMDGYVWYKISLNEHNITIEKVKR